MKRFSITDVITIIQEEVVKQLTKVIEKEVEATLEMLSETTIPDLVAEEIENTLPIQSFIVIPELIANELQKIVKSEIEVVLHGNNLEIMVQQIMEEFM